MNKNQRIVWLALIASAVIVLAIVYISRFITMKDVVHCPNGTTHPRVDAASFQTEYWSYAGKLEAKLGADRQFSGALEPKQVLAMSEAIQMARLHLQALAEGYNACAVSGVEFNDSRNSFGAMENLAREIEAALASHHGIKDDLVDKLVDQYVELARQSSYSRK